ncbi:MAG: flavin reductase family protein [Ancrocorticia sp.]
MQRLKSQRHPAARQPESRSESEETSLYDSFSLYGSGVTLITTDDGGTDRFFVAASVLTASVNPFTVAVSVGRYREALPAIAGGAPWAISVLTADHVGLVEDLTSPMTGDLTSDDIHERRLGMLVEAGAERSPEGTLWLPDALVTLWCSTLSLTPVNDQFLLVGEVTRGSARTTGTPLLRWNRSFHTLPPTHP